MAGKKTGKRLLTWVLVLVMALSLLPLNALAAGGPETDGGSGMNFDKRLVDDEPDGEGNYTIRMTAQATGKTTTTTEAAPMDIVLVLDQSGSMADDFNGKTTYKDEARRQYAMKAAVNSFIDEVAKKYTPNANHHMAIVTFDTNATELVGWTAVYDSDKDKLTDAIDNLTMTPSGATNVGKGMELAQNLMGSAPTDENRQKTVIVFTDGVPTTQSDFDTDVANTAISAANAMKASDVTIYTVGIFNGANPTEMYGASGFDTNSDGTVNSEWAEDNWGLFPSTDFQKADRPAGNRFLNLVSSNYPNADSIGLKRETSGLGILHSGISYKITKNFNRVAEGDYYLTASDASSLEKIFKDISTMVPEPDNAELNGDTVITDTLSDYFTFAGTAEDVKVYAIDANGNKKESEDAAKVKPVVTGKTVTVTGYDFSAHHTKSADPEELVIEIKVKPDTSYTNWGESGKYETNKGNATVTPPNIEEPIAKAASPEVYVETYQVTYGFDTTAPDGATHPEDNQYYISGQTADVKPPEPSSIELDGHTYTFNGWKNGEADVGEKIDISGNVTLTGSWSKTPNTASYTVNYLWNGTSIKDSTTDTAACGSTVNVTAPNIDGYTLIPDQEMSIEIGAGENVLNLNYYKNVTLTANSKTVTYDGQLHNGSPYDCEPLGLLPGHKVKSVDYTCAPQTNVGKYDIELDNAKIITADGADVTDLYQITYNYGTLIIEPCDVTVTIKGNTGTYEYDGTEKTVEGYTANINNNLYTEADFKLVDSQAKIRATVPGTYQMGLKPENFKNTNPNFNVTFVVKPDGKLTIENRPITITANDVTGKYNGQPHGENGYSITMGSLVDGHAATVTISGSKTDAGEYEELLVPRVTKIVDAKDKDVTSYYDISYEDGKLTINKRSVTLTSASASKVYDGTPLTKPEVTVGGDGFVDGEGATYNVTGTITNVGETKNTFTYTLDEGTKATNYTITKTEGTLKITKAPTYTFDLNDPDTIKVNKEFKSMYGRSAEKSFTATATIEKQETYIIVNPGIDNNVTNNGSAVPTKPDYTKVGEATGTVTLKAGKTEAFDFGKNSTFQLEQGDYRITVKETNSGDRYVTYDTKPYTRYFKVSEDGVISAIESITITNEYTKRHTAATPSKPTLNTGDHYAYVMGYPDGTVRPNGSITRAEVSAILFRLLSDKTRDEYFTTESSFTDVKAGAWYNNSIATLEKAGVIVDTAKGGAFRPNEAITRAELAAMLAQFSDAKPVKGVKFSDVSAEHWAYEAIAIAAKMGWIEGYPDGTFRPDATITRAEMMTLVNRALERVPSDEDHLLSKRVMLTFPDCKSGDWFYIAVQEATNSHTYERAATEKNGDEQWTALRANRDWTLLEK